MNLFKHTWRHIRRSPYQSLTVVMIMALLLFITLRFFVIAFVAQRALDSLGSKPQITIFFKDEATSKEIDDLKEKLNATGKVASQKYTSKEEALTIYREQYKKDPLLLELVTANILPASLEVSATDARYLAEFNEILKDNPAIEEVVYLKDVVDTLISVTSGVRTEGLIWMVSLSVVAFFVILMAVGIKISSKKEEIEIMKLVGASSWHIGKPFILEGAFYGILAGILAWGLSYLLLFHETPFLVNIASFLKIEALPLQPLFMVEFLGGVVVSGLLIGILGSLLAVWRYL